MADASSGLIGWFDIAPWRYWAIGWIAWSGLVGLVIARLRHDWRPRPAKSFPGWLDARIFLAAAILAVFAFRWPGMFAGPLRNPDETQLAAGAMTYWTDPVPWRSVDLHTAGPVDAYFLWPALLFDGEPSYTGIRAMALFAHLCAALACYGLFRQLSSDGVARLATLPLLGFAAFTNNWEYIQYTSEQASFCFLALAGWLIGVAVWREDWSETRRRWQIFTTGLLLGSLPFAKLQSVPLGIALGVLAMIVLGTVTPTAPARGRRIAVLLIGAALPAALIALALTVYGLWAQAWMVYIKSNFAYVDHHVEDRLRLVREFYPLFLRDNLVFRPFFLGCVGLAIASAPFVFFARRPLRFAWLAALALFAIGGWTVVYPGRIFWHYLHFLLLPTAWLGGFSIMVILDVLARRGSPAGHNVARWIAAGGVGLATLVPLMAAAGGEPTSVGNLAEARSRSVHPVAAQIRALSQPGDRLVIWGWAPRFYVESGLAQGSREAHTQLEIEPGPMISFYRARLMWDLRKRQPEFILDAVTLNGGIMYTAKSLFGPQIFPELAAYIDANYRLVADDDGLRLYQRRDRHP